MPTSLLHSSIRKEPSRNNLLGLRVVSPSLSIQGVLSMTISLSISLKSPFSMTFTNFHLYPLSLFYRLFPPIFSHSLEPLSIPSKFMSCSSFCWKSAPSSCSSLLYFLPMEILFSTIGLSSSKPTSLDFNGRVRWTFELRKMKMVTKAENNMQGSLLLCKKGLNEK